MSIYLVTRSHYVGPAGKKIQKFNDETILSWFQNRWTDARAATESDLGYFFRDLTDTEEEEEREIPLPESDEELAALLEEHLYAEGGILFSPHCIQILHDDDELEFAFYLFDDDYRKAQPEKVAFLLHEECELPTNAGNHSVRTETETTPLEPAGEGEGVTYLLLLSYYDSSNLTDLDGHYRIEGVRVPQLATYLRGVSDDLDGDEWPVEFQALRELALLADETATLRAVMEWAGRMPFPSLNNQFGTTAYTNDDFTGAMSELRRAMKELYKGETEPSGPLSQVQAEGHLAQLFLHTDTWDKKELFHRWIFFDDLWLGENQELGEAILRYASQWDVLS